MSYDRLKKPRLAFTQVPNDLICSTDLTCKAKSVYCYLISRPDDWKFYTKEIVKNMKESIKTIDSALKELIAYGWIEKEQIRVKGRFSHTVYTLFYEVSTVHLKTVNDKTANDKTANRKLPTTNTNSTNKESINTYSKDKVRKMMKFRKAFMNNYMFDGFIAYDLSLQEYDYIEYNLNSDGHVIVKETKERLTKELSLEIWNFLYEDYNKQSPINNDAFMLLNYKKEALQIEN